MEMSSRREHKKTRVDESGQLAIPTEYRDELGLVPGASVTLVRVGDSLLVIPDDAELEDAFDRLATFFENAAVSEEDLMAELARIRQEEFAQRFPHSTGTGE
jgi:AbrB family looped-hinge helix DNA binding protein